MSRQDVYNQLPAIIRRLFTWALLAVGVFLLFWYYGGYNLWGHFLEFVFNIALFPMDIVYKPGISQGASFVYTFTLENGQTGQVHFLVNMLHIVLLEVITFLAVWPHKNLKSFFRLAGWTLVFTVLYQCFNVGIQLYAAKIGPSMASELKIFWEETWWHRLIDKVAKFDKFILRYWGGFPVFLFALVADYFTKKPYSSKKAEGKPSRRKS